MGKYGFLPAAIASVFGLATNIGIEAAPDEWQPRMQVFALSLYGIGALLLVVWLWRQRSWFHRLRFSWPVHLAARDAMIFPSSAQPDLQKLWQQGVELRNRRINAAEFIKWNWDFQNWRVAVLEAAQQIDPRLRGRLQVLGEARPIPVGSQPVHDVHANALLVFSEILRRIDESLKGLSEPLPAPKLEVIDLNKWDREGEQFVRVQVHNNSATKIVGLKARLVRISDSAGALEQGEELDDQGNYRKIDFPIQLFTQERLRERLAEGDRFARPFNLDPFEKKWIEVFQIAEPIGREIRLFDAATRRELITPDDMKFDCEIAGLDLPILFSVSYASARAADGFDLILQAANGSVITQRKYVSKIHGWRAANS